MNVVKFHEKLRELKGDMSEAALAEASGLSYGAIHSYCLGRRMPTFRAAAKIARALGVSLDLFAECADETEPKRKPSARKPRARAGGKARKGKGA